MKYPCQTKGTKRDGKEDKINKIEKERMIGWLQRKTGTFEKERKKERKKERNCRQNAKKERKKERQKKNWNKYI